MPKNLYSQNIIHRKKKSGGKILSGLVVIVGICLSITMALLFSNYITVGSFSFLTNSELKQNGYTVYCICVNQTTNNTLAKSYASSNQSKGGAGYIYYDQATYSVLASAYKEKTDAQNVLEKLSAQGTSAKLLEISTPNIKVSGAFSTNEQSVLNSALNTFSNTFDTLYDMAIALDTNISTHSEIKNQTTNLLSTIKSIKNNFDNTFNSKITNNLLQISISLNDCIEYVDDIFEASNISVALKYCYFQIVEENISLNKIINT